MILDQLIEKKGLIKHQRRMIKDEHTKRMGKIDKIFDAIEKKAFTYRGMVVIKLSAIKSLRNKYK